MSCASSIYNSRTALRRVFLATPSELSSSSQLRYLLAPSLRTLYLQPPVLDRRFFNGIRRTALPPSPDDPRATRAPPVNPRDPVTHPSVQAPTRDSRSVRAHQPKGSAPKSPPSSSLPRDDAIRQVSDYVVLRREDGHLTEPRPLSSVLTEAHIRDQTVVTIVLPRPGQQQQRAGASHRHQHPICVVLDRQAYEEAEAQRAREEREKREGEKKARRGTKELEINWAIAPHDLEHKMKRFKEFLGKGLRVEMLLLRKGKRKGKVFRQATEDEADELLKRVREEAGQVPGAREFKAPSGIVGNRYQLFFEGPQQ